MRITMVLVILIVWFIIGVICIAYFDNTNRKVSDRVIKTIFYTIIADLVLVILCSILIYTISNDRFSEYTNEEVLSIDSDTEIFIKNKKSELSEIQGKLEDGDRVDVSCKDNFAYLGTYNVKEMKIMVSNCDKPYVIKCTTKNSMLFLYEYYTKYKLVIPSNK